jgi:GcrA cell cycle regulator
MSWTDERVELLKKLWMDGLSASQIANELGDGVTRNAVIGKVHRLKLSTRVKPAPTAPRPQAAPRPTPVQAQPARRPTPAQAPAMAPLAAVASRTTIVRTPTIGATALKVELELEPEVQPMAQTHELVIPESERISLLGLNEHTCKWPIGDPLSSNFHFCGRTSEDNRPYCDFHSRKAYHQIEKKRR